MNEFAQAVGTYVEAIASVQRVGTPELSHYTALNNLFNAVGGQLKPAVRAVVHHHESGPKQPDLGLFSQGNDQSPDRGVVEVKGIEADLDELIGSEQVGGYWREHRLVLVTNLRQFALVGEDGGGAKAVLERYSLGDDVGEFDELLRHPKAAAKRHGVRLGEYLARVMEHRTTIAEPRELARLLASYARDALARVGDAEAERSLERIRQALERALGMHFEGDDGAGFFRSTLVQTLFYGVFAAWVLWARSGRAERFRWRYTVEYLQVPVLGVLFHQLTDRGTLRRLNLVDVLDWTEAALERVDADAFLAGFEQGEAVQYFYEPFLEAFDPELRKQLGVWYTPREVVQYMVARVDRALRDDLGIAQGLADQRVFVLDPCCGTGAFLVETLRRIAQSSEELGLGAAAGAALKQAALERVFGFEIMPAPLVVAHLQIGLALEQLGVSLEPDQRAGVFLTNALTGWEEVVTEPLLFPELEEERERANRVKRERRILVVLGNPPYNGFAGVAVDEERELTQAYREVSGGDVPRPEGQGLNDLYVRFFRVAERRIVERTGEGVVCFISNYSWLDGLSFPGMRERYLDAFDVVRVDNLHGDRIISEYAPDGRTSETVFAVKGESPGIRVGAAIATLSRTGKGDRSRVLYRDFDHARAEERRAALLDSVNDTDAASTYADLSPHPGLGLPFKPAIVNREWFEWPSLVDLFPIYFPGVKTGNDALFVNHDRGALTEHVRDYFAEAQRTLPDDTETTRYTYRPFDSRWIWWSAAKSFLDRPRPEYKPHVFDGNLWFSAAQHIRKGASETQAAVTQQLGASHVIERGASWIPLYLRDDQFGELSDGVKRTPNLSDLARRYIESHEATASDLFHHALATMHDPAYREANAGGLRMGWPRIPLPDDGAALLASAERGRILARLLDSEADASELLDGSIALPTTVDGSQMERSDFELAAGWGHFGNGGAVMPGQGRLSERGELVDVWLNDRVYWANVPRAVWEYRLGGYQVLKKWLSYRERKVLGRALRLEELQWFSEVARRVSAVLEVVG